MEKIHFCKTVQVYFITKDPIPQILSVFYPFCMTPHWTFKIRLHNGIAIELLSYLNSLKNFHLIFPGDLKLSWYFNSRIIFTTTQSRRATCLLKRNSAYANLLCKMKCNLFFKANVVFLRSYTLTMYSTLRFHGIKLLWA